MGRFCAIALLLAACNARLGATRSDVDASGNGGAGSDASPGTMIDAAPDAPACFNGRVLYLNYGPQAITHAGTSDATQNQVDFLTKTTSTVPAFHGGSATDAQQVTDLVRAGLSSFPVTVVTDRPTSGPYVMILFGGTQSTVGTGFGFAQNTLDCGDTNKNDVGWVSDTVPSLQLVANFAIGAVGFGLGLTATTDPNDCMCGWGNSCQQNGTACTLSPNIADKNQCGQATQNEVATFQQAFCQ